MSDELVSHGESGNNSDLGNSKESLGERDDVLHLAHCVDAVLHGLRMFGPRTVEHALDASNVVLGPLFVWEANGLGVVIFHQQPLLPHSI
jgi:hypothetical protein